MKKLELLKKVQRVEAPPFLSTRIREKIRIQESEKLPVSWRWAGAMAFSVLIFFNIFMLNAGHKAAPAEQIAQGLQLQLSNQLYDE